MSVQSTDQMGKTSTFDGYQRMPKNGILFSRVGLCGSRVTRPLTFNVSETNDFDKGEN